MPERLGKCRNRSELAITGHYWPLFSLSQNVSKPCGQDSQIPETCCLAKDKDMDTDPRARVLPFEDFAHLEVGPLDPHVIYHWRI